MGWFVFYGRVESGGGKGGEGARADADKRAKAQRTLGVPAPPPGGENYIWGGRRRERSPGRSRSARCGWRAQEVRSSLGEQPSGNVVRMDLARRGDGAARVKRDPRSARSARGTLAAGSSFGEMGVRSAESRRVARRGGRRERSPGGPRSARRAREPDRVGSSLDEERSGKGWGDRRAGASLRGGLRPAPSAHRRAELARGRLTRE